MMPEDDWNWIRVDNGCLEGHGEGDCDGNKGGRQAIAMAMKRSRGASTRVAGDIRLGEEDVGVFGVFIIKVVG